MTPAVATPPSSTGRVSNLNGLRPKAPAEPHKAFKSYEPGFLHVDVKYLPRLLGE
jgi:hypothetical protein